MNFFDAGSPYLGHPLLTPERTAEEIDVLFGLLADGGQGSDLLPMQVVDIGCGFGRHAIELARRGHSVVGIDPSETMISEAGILEAGARSSDPADGALRFVQGTAAALDDAVGRASVDLALCLFTTFGQLASRQDSGAASTTDLLRHVRAALKPGGVLVLEVPERARAIALLVETEQLGATTVTRSIEYRDATTILHEHFETPNKTFDLGYQLFSSDELASLVEAAGFTVVSVRDSALVPPPPTFMTLLAVAP